MKQTLIAVALALVAGSAHAALPPNVPGICSDTGDAGIGCGYDATKIDVFGATLNPIRPVIEFTWCPDMCYEPAHYYDPSCNYCQYALPDYDNMTYRVPTNAFVQPYTEAGGCYEQSTQSTVDDYMNLVGNTVGHDGWFHSWSRTTVNYYEMYYKNEMQQSLEYKFLIWHTISLIPEQQKTTFEFNLQAGALPATYDNATYKAFIQDYGTHYMDKATMGGSALMTQYFHSCFEEQMGGNYVYSQSSSSFFGIFNSADASGAGFKKTDGKYKDWSNSTIKLIGGAADKYGLLNWTNTLNKDQVQDWEDSIKFSMSPLQYTFKPIHTLLSGAQAENMQHALVEYGVDVETFNQQLVTDLIPKEHWVKPSWCNFDPKPPTRSLRGVARKEPSEAAKRLLGADTLKPCPSLPGDEDVRRMLRERA